MLGVCLSGQGWSQQQQQQQRQIIVSNSDTYDRKEIVVIPYENFVQHFQVDSIFTVRDTKGQVIVHQLEKLGQQKPQHVLLQVAVPAGQQQVLHVAPEAAPAVASKTYARYVPERLDDFAWENDVVAFRLYGKALEGHKDDAQGMDYWAKRTDRLIIDHWYKTNDYHKDHGEGLDYYSVGQTLGAGDMALFLDKEVQYTWHYRGHQVLDNGPLRTTFRLDYEPQVIKGQRVAFQKTISLDAGSNFNKIQIDLNNKDRQRTPIVVGVAKRKEDNPALTVAADGSTLAYWEPDMDGHGRTGVALILPIKGAKYHPDRKEQALLATHIDNGTPFIYYNGAVWDRAGKITTTQQWNDAVEAFKHRVKSPLTVHLK